MTRKEQIEQAAVEYQMKNKPMAIGGDAFADMTYRLNINPAFVAGAEWADKQFEKERLARLLNKMYEWLKDNIKDYVFVHSYSSNVNVDIDTLVEDLQKSMEEKV